MGRGSSKLGGGGNAQTAVGTSVGQTVTSNTRQLSTSELNSMINSYSDGALTSQKVEDFAEQIMVTANIGDSIHTTEPNRWHNINQYFVYQGGDNWLHVRRNMNNGDVYENRMVSTRTMARDVLGTALGRDEFRWQYN